ncbi:MAG TPA: hypothetical protein VLD63_11475 [Anaerolineales bacterium]|nr:hypothetical protein [Anaerolineales bacterium]
MRYTSAMRHPPRVVGPMRKFRIRPRTDRVNENDRPIAEDLVRRGVPLDRWSVITGLVVLSLMTLAGCAVPPEPEGPQIATADDLQAALQDAGMQVGSTGASVTLGSLGGGREVTVDGNRILIFEYESEEARATQTASWLADEAPAVGSTDPFLTVWARGQILVVYRGSDGGLTALLSGLLGDPLTLAQDAVDEPYPPAVAEAIGFLAQDLGAEPRRITVLEYDPAEWPDSCLGLGQPNESCAQVVTPGWRILLRFEDATYVMRSDEFGQVVRQE